MCASPNSPEQIHAVRIAAGGARLLLGCDLVVSASAEALSKAACRARRRAIVNSHEIDHRRFHPQPRPAVSRAATCAPASPRAVGQGGAEFIDATGLATGLLGDSIASNLFMLGYAYQQGLVPVSAAAIERAIELNGVAVEFNRKRLSTGAAAPRSIRPRSRRAPCRTTPCRRAIACRRRLDEIIARRVAFLTEYQNAAYAERYAARIRRLREAEAARRRRHGADRGGRPRAVQADGLQGRIRGRPALHRDRFRGSASPSSSRVPTSCASIWRRRCWPIAIPQPGI